MTNGPSSSQRSTFLSRRATLLIRAAAGTFICLVGVGLNTLGLSSALASAVINILGTGVALIGRNPFEIDPGRRALRAAIKRAYRSLARGSGLGAAWSARRLAALAVLIGGSRRARWWEEFRADLERNDLSRWRQVAHASGFVRAALFLRMMDLAGPMQRGRDWALAHPRTEIIAGIVAVCVAWSFYSDGGWEELRGNLENVFSSGLLVWGPGVFLRTIFGVPSAIRSRRPEERSDDM